MLKYDYLKALENQCDAIIYKKDIKAACSLFSEICRNLTRDFLPPIERADIAAVSYSLVDIAVKAKEAVFTDDIKKQINSIKPLLNSLFLKNKTCGDEIRRLIEINCNFKSNDPELNLLNEALSDFYKSVLTAYFGNL